MTSTTIRTTSEPRGELLLGAMVLGVLALVGAIALMSTSGAWLAFAAAISALLIVAGGLMLVVARLLSRTGDDDLSSPATVTDADPVRRPRRRLPLTTSASALPTGA